MDIVQPTGGWFCVVSIKGSIVQKFFKTRAEVDAYVPTMVAQKRNVFFSLAKFKTKDGRTKPNVQALRAFWLDIDCGEDKAKAGKGYATQDEAIDALRGFIKEVGMKRPIVVSSGGGVHVYWPLAEDATREQWEPVAAQLKARCMEHGLLIDPSVFEVSRILRIPGTKNFKEDTPRDVTVMQDKYTPQSLSEFATPFISNLIASVATPVAGGSLFGNAPRGKTKLGEKLLDATDTSFKRIIDRTLAGDGCDQLTYCVNNNATLSEPLWRAALSVADKCIERDKAITSLSQAHPGYNPVDADKKAANTGGPQSCAIFDQENPNICPSCPHWGKIKTPIQLGKIVVPSTEEERELTEDGIVYKIPEPPWGFTRPKGGGIWLEALDEESEPRLVYCNDLYVVKRMYDPIDGETLLMRLHLPAEGVQEFTVPLKAIKGNGDWRDVLASQGVACEDKQFRWLVTYIIRMITDLQNNSRRRENMRVQFGWADKDTKFIIGDVEVAADGFHNSPPSTTTAPLIPHSGPKGTFEKWKEVFDLYGRPGLEPHAFAALTAFGSPLLKFTGQRGAIVNMIYPTSGTGKTTILHMCNSVYGSPEGMCTIKEDTMNAKITRLGVYNNLPYTIDEMTNMSDGEFSTLAYSVSQGKGKERMKGSTNELRQNLTSWQTIALCSSNSSFYQKLGGKKTGADGEMMRLLEYHIRQVNAIDQAEAKQLFDHQLLQNYGHAGPKYIRWLVENKKQAIDLVGRVQTNLDRELGLTQRERIWSAVAASNIAGGMIAQDKCGLMSWDLKPILNYTMEMIDTMRSQVSAPVVDVVSIIGDYMNSNIKSTLVIKGDADARSMLDAPPALDPTYGELRIRYEPDTKNIYIVTKPFKKHCVEYQIDYAETLKLLKAKGIFKDAEVKRVTKGMKISNPPVHCLILDGGHPDFFDVDDAIETAQAGGDDS